MLSGKLRSEELMTKYQVAVQRLKSEGITPKLVVITVGEDPASMVYVGQKERRALEVGMAFDWIRLPETISQAELNECIECLNKDETVSGLIVQFPLPDHLDKLETVQKIATSKDVDGFHPENLGLITLNQSALFPCTPRGIIDLLEAHNIPIQGQDVVIIGRSHVVGMPLSILLINMGATVTVCSRSTKDRDKYTRDADIVIVATGVPGLLGANQIKEGAVVVDVGINRLETGKLVGDVLYDEVKEKASFITPVPGGVGPMTVAMLLEQTILCACLQHKLNPTDYLERE